MGSLRALADAKGLKIGTAAPPPAAADEQYRQVLSREFNQVVAENALKFGPLRPTRDRFDWGPAEQIVRFAAEHAMAVRGHALAWHEQMPTWLTQDPPPAEEFRQILREHVQAVVRHFAGQIFAWDVVNEAIAQDGTLRPSLLVEKLGVGWVAEVFQWAREADSDVKLFYNDYGAEELNAKSDGIYSVLQEFLRRGVPIDGVGLQCHLALDKPLAVEAVRQNLRRLLDLGLAVHITELDVRIPLPTSDSQKMEQARMYGDLLKVYLEETAAGRGTTAEGWRRVFTMWGFTDRWSWIPVFFKGYGSALLFDEAYQPKPAYEAIRRVLNEG